MINRRALVFLFFLTMYASKDIHSTAGITKSEIVIGTLFMIITAVGEIGSNTSINPVSPT
jgi:hypothetical protein